MGNQLPKPGFIKLYRVIQDNWIWDDKPFSKGQAWIDLLMEANFTTVKKPINGEIFIFERGQIYKSKLELSIRWGWSRKKVDSFIKLLEKDKMLSQKCTSKGTILTIENYEFYQGEGTTKEHQKNNGGTSEEHQKNNGGTQDKKDKKDKNVKKDKNINIGVLIDEYLKDKSTDFKDAFNDFIKVRSNSKSPVKTERQLTLLINKLEKLSKDVETQIKIIDQSIVNNWKDFYPLKEQNQKQKFNNFEQRDYDDIEAYLFGLDNKGD